MTEPIVLPADTARDAYLNGVITCPRCGGMKTECDGSVVAGSAGIAVTPASKCIMCMGSGLVKVYPYHMEE